MRLCVSDLKKRYRDVRRAAYYQRKRRKQVRERERFYRNPYEFVKQLFSEGASGALKASKEELEDHLHLTYSAANLEEVLHLRPVLVAPPQVEHAFDLGELKAWEVNEVIRKARAGSAAGQNGLSYKLFKYCPRIRKVLWSILRVIWRKWVVPDSWCVAEGIYIPKEVNSKEIGQFRPIYLLNVDGKVLMSVLARRLRDYVLENKVVNWSVQKAGIPGFPGCLEHAQMIWESIQSSKREQKCLDVVWLDLANAYGSVPHWYLQFALKFFGVPDVVCGFLAKYYLKFQMRFTTKAYTTRFQALQIGIPMGCPVSPLMFVLGMEIMTRDVLSRLPAVVLEGVSTPSVRAFMDDLTLMSSSEQQVERGLVRLDELLKWTGMRFKPKKCRSVSLRRGRIVQKRFLVDGEHIPQVSDEGVKSLGRWYEGNLSDRHRGVRISNDLTKWLVGVDKTLLPGKAKVWCCQFGVLPRLLWQLLVYEVAVTRVERMQQSVNLYYRKWLGVPRMLSDTALYSRSCKLWLPLTSLVEEFKVGKVRLVMMMRESKDDVVRQVAPEIRTGRKWKAEAAASEAVAQARWKEVRGCVTTGRLGLGYGARWRTCKAKGKLVCRGDVLQAVREREEEVRYGKAVQQAVQGAWTKWEDVQQRRVTWSQLLCMSAGAIRFLVSATFDLLPTPVNRCRWGLQVSDMCGLCGQARGSLEHALTSCKSLLPAYTWRHNQVLRVLGDAAAGAIKLRRDRGAQVDREVRFVKEGECPVHEKVNGGVRGSLMFADDWDLRVDEGRRTIPSCVVQTNLRPDMVMLSTVARRLVVMELTVPWETRMAEAGERKRLRYSELLEECERGGWATEFFTVEVGCRGFSGHSLRKWLVALGWSGSKVRMWSARACSAAEVGSAWIIGKLKMGQGS